MLLLSGPSCLDFTCCDNHVRVKKKKKKKKKKTLWASFSLVPAPMKGSRVLLMLSCNALRFPKLGRLTRLLAASALAMGPSVRQPNGSGASLLIALLANDKSLPVKSDVGTAIVLLTAMSPHEGFNQCAI